MRLLNKTVLTMFACSAIATLPVVVAASDGAEGLAVHKKQLLETRACVGCDLHGVNLNRENLVSVNLEGANLSGARLRLATLAQANLRNCNLQGAEFGGADLAGADLRGAKLQGATFSGAYLVGVMLDKGVDLSQIAAAPVDETTDVSSDKEKVALEGRQNPQSVASPKVVTPVEEEKTGFFDGVKNFFGAGTAEKPTQKVEATVEVAAKDSERQVRDVQETVTAPAVSTSEQAKQPTPKDESGFFDSTVASIKGLFGQKEEKRRQEEPKTVLEKAPVEIVAAPVEAPPASVEVSTVPVVVAPVPVEAKEKNSVENSSQREQHAVASTAPSGGATPVPVQRPAKDEPGFFDRTIAGVKGLFGGGDESSSTVASSGKGDVATPAKVQEEGKVAAEPDQNSSAVSQGPAAHQEGANTAVGAPQKNEIPALVSAPTDVAKNLSRLLDTGHCYNCALQGVDLSGKNLDKADLEGADLSGSKLAGADIREANLKGAVLIGADLRNANLKGADLYKANLSNADLTGANIEGALFDDVQHSGAVGWQMPVR